MTSQTDIHGLLTALTLDEKLTLLAGADFWTTHPIERLGIPAVKVTDGPNGARGARGAEPNLELTSACFPNGSALGATWNPALVEQIGSALADETRSKGAQVLLAPTVNIHRSPLAGRNFECYSEDPYLTSRLAVAYIRGLQTAGVSACIKHFVCNDSEFERNSISSEVGPRALHEIYLPPFRAAVQEAGVWAVMSAYNRLNGVYASENHPLLVGLLKQTWGFDGIVMSDWFGTYSDDVAAGGLDLEMPGPARRMAPELLHSQLADGTLTPADVDDKVLRLLRWLDRVGALGDGGGITAERADNRPEHRALIRRAAAEAAVLLKHDDDLLPLSDVRSIAVIGVNAVYPPVMGGGSAYVTPHYVVSPLDGVTRRAAQDGIAVHYAPGCAVHKRLPMLDPTWIRDGLTLSVFDNETLSGEPAHVETTLRSEFQWFGGPPTGATSRAYSLRLSGTLVVPADADYALSLQAAGMSRLWIDDQLLIDTWQPYTPQSRFFDMGTEYTVTLALSAGRPIALKVEFSSDGLGTGGALRVGCMPQIAPDAEQAAAALAAQCDVAIIFAGTNGDWESEGYDRPDMALPMAQDALIAAVAAANPRSVVVLNSGGPLALPWVDDVAAIVQAWFPGQEYGNAIADVLFGDVNPAGRLPVTYPVRLEDNPAFINYPGENGRVHYGEGLFVGYRYYDAKQVAPRFPFGHGLSYTQFRYDDVALSAAQIAAGQPLDVTVTLTNVGSRSGQEVVQLYVHDRESRLRRPVKELKAFAKLDLAAGETRSVTLTLPADALAYYDDTAAAWVSEPGAFDLLIGASSRDIRLTAAFELLA